jgi:RhtB (resistance to homoserine/threonine) family protein
MTETIDPALWASLLTITGIWTITVLSPGPNFLATSHAALAHSRRAGVLVAAGISLGTTIWATASLLGLGLLFQTAGWLYHVVRVVGAAYLIYLGLRMILAARARTATAGPVGPGVSGLQAFRRGMLTDLGNPKAAAFFTSLFAVAVPPLAPLWFDAAIVAAVVVIAGGWYATVACAMASRPVAAFYRRAQRIISYAAGAVFIGFGIRLATDR